MAFFYIKSSVEDIHVVVPLLIVFENVEKRVMLHTREYRKTLSNSTTVLNLETYYDLFDWKKTYSLGEATQSNAFSILNC